MTSTQTPPAAGRGWNHPAAPAAPRPSKPHRRLKPEVAARLIVRRGAAPIEVLYRKPVEDLSPRELALMRAAFLKG